MSQDCAITFQPGWPEGNSISKKEKKKERKNNRCWWGCGEKGMLMHCWWECKLVQPWWKAVSQFLKELKTELPFDTAIPLLSIYPKENKLFCHKDTCMHMFIAALFTIAQTWNQPSNSRVDKENMAHIHHGIFCSHKKRWVDVLCRDMNGARNDHSQQTNTGTGNQTPHVLTHKWELNNENTWTQGGKQHTLGSVGGWGGEHQDKQLMH